MKSQVIALVFGLVSACSGNDSTYELIGVTDFKTVDNVVCVWVNDEPVFHLWRIPSCPRISNTYPIKKGDNTIVIQSVSPGNDLKTESFKPYLFYSNGRDEREVPLAAGVSNSILAGNFHAEKSYGVGAALDLVGADEKSERKAREWVSEYLGALKNRSKEEFARLFAPDVDSGKLYEQAKDFFSADAQIVKMLKADEFNVRRGKSLVYVFGNGELAEWKIGNVSKRYDGLLFAACSEGLFLRVSGGEWIKLNA